jgi:hypothetical protein
VDLQYLLTLIRMFLHSFYTPTPTHTHTHIVFWICNLSLTSAVIRRSNFVNPNSVLTSFVCAVSKLWLFLLTQNVHFTSISECCIPRHMLYILNLVWVVHNLFAKCCL